MCSIDCRLSFLGQSRLFGFRLTWQDRAPFKLPNDKDAYCKVVQGVNCHRRIKASGCLYNELKHNRHPEDESRCPPPLLNVGKRERQS